MALFTDMITIYNHYKADGKDHWKRTVLEGVQWSRKVRYAPDSGGKLVSTVTVSVTVPIRDGYVPADQWQDLKDRTGKWTVDTKQHLDVFALGEVDAELDAAEYTPAKFLRDHQDAFIVSCLSDNTNRDRLKHWKVST